MTKILICFFISLSVIIFLYNNQKRPSHSSNCFLKEPLTFTKLKKCFIDHQSQFLKVEDFLAQLPSSYREKFTLVYHSKSLQAASYENPRVIFFGHGQTELILAYTGNSQSQESQNIEKDSFDKIETIAWNKVNKKFEFYEFHFPSAQNHLKFAVLSEKNPTQCFRCHGQDLRPNWQHYNV